MSEILLGPIISIANNDEFAITIVVNSNDVLQLELNGGQQIISESNRTTIKSGDHVQFNFKIPATNANQKVKYHIKKQNNLLHNKHGMNSWEFEIPAQDITPRIYTCSCNGEGKLHHKHLKSDNLVMWKKLRETHKDHPCHLLVMSGDQIYADPMWEDVTYLRNRNKILKKKETLAGFQLGTTRNQLKDELCDFFEDLYFAAWGHEDISFSLASTPSIMMWDDHDIFDGYGSHGKEVQDSEIVECIFEVAKFYFELFQSRPSNSNVYLDVGKTHFAQHITYRNYEFFVLDGRAERTEDIVCSKNQYDQLKARLSGSLFQNGPYTNDRNPKILCMVVSVPVAHFHYTKFAFSMSAILSGSDFRTANKDDTLDQWSHDNHREEQKEFLKIMTDAAIMHDVRYAYIISGDNHSSAVAQAYGIDKIADSNGNLFHPYIAQIVASPIVHRSHKRIEKFILKTFSRSKMIISGCMLQFKNFGGIKKEVIHKRNFIVLNKDVNIPGIQRASGLKALLYTKQIPEKGDKNHGYMLPFFKQKKPL